jgi:hypothetical protein
VFVDRLVAAPLGELAGAGHERAQLDPLLEVGGEVAVPGGQGNATMEQIVQMILQRRAVQERLALAPHQVPQRLHLWLGGMTCSEPRSHALQHLA